MPTEIRHLLVLSAMRFRFVFSSVRAPFFFPSPPPKPTPSLAVPSGQQTKVKNTFVSAFFCGGLSRHPRTSFSSFPLQAVPFRPAQEHLSLPFALPLGWLGTVRFLRSCTCPSSCFQGLLPTSTTLSRPLRIWCTCQSHQRSSRLFFCTCPHVHPV